MIKLQHFLAGFIAPVFLLHALIVEAQTPTTISTASLPTSLCDSLKGQAEGVQKRLSQYRELVKGRQCVILSADPAEDLAELVKQTPENTVILLSSGTSAGVTPSSSMAPAPSPAASSVVMPSSSVIPKPVKTPVEYFVDSVIVLKNGQDIIGAADEGFEIVIRDRPDFQHKHILSVGSTDQFKRDETKNSHIRHVTFRTTRNNKRVPIDSIVFAECFNRKLVIEDNVFYLPVKAAVTLDCKEFTVASDKDRAKGPCMEFANNRVIGERYNSIDDKIFPYFIPNQGIFINLPAIVNQSERISIIGNTFEGNMAEAAEFKIGAGSSINVFKNTINISNAGNTTRDSVRKGGFVLAGPTESIGVPPAFFLAGNQIKVTRTAITVRGQLGLTFACNHLQAVNPWWQPQKQFVLKSLPVPLGKAAEVCSGGVSSTAVMPTHTSNPTVVMSTFSPNPTHVMSTLTPNSTVVMSIPDASSRFANTWTAINSSLANACSGLVNFEGQFFFESEVCQTIYLPLAPVNSTTGIPATPSTGSASVATPLAVMAGLFILLNL